MKEILKRPIVTEKTARLTKENQYVFEVSKEATKSEIKKAVEENFGVNVLSVKIIKVPPKRRRIGRISGWKKGYKKAIVKIEEGQKIDIFPEYEKKS
jgi:large subunit ribosomal protein L23